MQSFNNIILFLLFLFLVLLTNSTLCPLSAVETFLKLFHKPIGQQPLSLSLSADLSFACLNDLMTSSIALSLDKIECQPKTWYQRRLFLKTTRTPHHILS